jgi:cytochrome P450
MYNPFKWPDFLFNMTHAGKEHKRCLEVLQGFTKKVIRERDAEFEANDFVNQKRVAFLDILLKAKHDDPTITFEDIQEEVDTFMFEGHDTTAAAASWACHLIGSHPEVQKKLHEEMDTIFGNSTRPITNDDLRDLKYLDCVIKETLRLFPSVAFFARKISDDDTVGKQDLKFEL